MIDVGAIKKLKFKGKDPDYSALASELSGETEDSYMQELGCVWDENIRFMQGQQHIYYNKAIKGFEEIPRTNFNKFIPRPKTNLILPAVQALTSILTKNKPNAMISSNSENQRDTGTADLAQNIQDAKWEMDDEQLKHAQAAIILLSSGTVFRKDYWDTSLGPYSEPLDGPAGDNCVEMRSPFEVTPDYMNGEYFKETYVKSVDWVKEYYDVDGPGYTGMARDVQEDSAVSSLMSKLTRLQTSASEIGNGSSILKGSTVVTEFYLKPCAQHPDGLMAVGADEKTLYVSKSPYWESRYKDSWHPYTVGKWLDIYYRWHGLGVVEQLVPLQRRLNAIDAIIILNRLTMVSPQWLVPKGCGVPEGYISGAPGLQIPYNPAGANGAKPEAVFGKGLPVDVYKERERVVEEIHKIAGDNEVMAGLRPTGVDTAAALGMLLEQSYSKFSPQIQQWESFIERGQTKKLRMLAKKYREPRPDLIERLRDMNRENLDTHIISFIGDDFKDNCNVRVEAGSSLPRSSIMEQERYKEMAGMGLLGQLDPTSNPIGNKEFLEKFGMTPVHNQLNVDVEKARYVNSVLIAIDRGEFAEERYDEIMLKEIEKKPEVLSVHHQVLTDAMKRPGFKGGAAFEQRFMEIVQAMQEQEAQQVDPQGSDPSLQDTGPNTSQGDGLAMGPSL